MKIAIVGGAIAEIGHIPAACQIDVVEVTAVVVADLSRAEGMAERFGIRGAAKVWPRLKKKLMP